MELLHAIFFQAFTDFPVGMAVYIAFFVGKDRPMRPYAFKKFLRCRCAGAMVPALKHVYLMYFAGIFAEDTAFGVHPGVPRQI